MKVVLLADITNIGRIGEIANVADGYGRNFLIPNGMAELATRSTLRSAEFQQKLKTNEDRRDRIEGEQIAQTLQGATVTLGARVGSQNRLHGEITNQDVSHAIQEELGVEIDRHKIEIERPIRSLGIFMLPVRISKGLEASITVEIIEESELVARQEAAVQEAAERAAEAEDTQTDEQDSDDLEQDTASDLDEPDNAPA